MSSIGPKTPHSPPALPAPAGGGDSTRMAETLARLRHKQAPSVEAASTAPGTMDAFNASGLAGGDGRAAAHRLGAAAAVLPPTLLPGQGGAGGPSGRGVLDVRLGGMRIPGATPVGGQAAKGDLVVERPEDLAALRGVVTFSGNLAIAESSITGADLDALRHLAVVEGNLALEGNRALTSLSGLSALTEVKGSFYAGFNEGLERLELPKLREVGGALVIEGHARLTGVDLASLESVGKYLHLHENDVLEQALFGALETLGAEVSIVDNPRLVTVALPLLTAGPGDVEIAQNGAKLFGTLGIV